MAIQSINTGSIVSTATQTKSTSKATLEAKQQPVKLASDEDTISITAKAQDFKKATDAIASTPIVDEKRVTALKTAIEAGQYSIDPDRVAKKILQQEIQRPNTT